MSKGAWGGLITNASPFAIPVGAAVEQVNLAADVPGQIYVRGGMRKVAFTGGGNGAANLVDCHPFTYAGQSRLICLNADGELVVLDSPAYGPEPDRPLEPALSAATGMSASYTMRYVAGSVDSGNENPPPPTSSLISSLSGGGAATSTWPYVVNAASACAAQGAIAEYTGGRAGSQTFPGSVAASELCANDL